jgi:hypothetical protein
MAEIEIRGVPTVYVATVEFTDEEMLDIAERAFEELLANLVSG